MKRFINEQSLFLFQHMKRLQHSRGITVGRHRKKYRALNARLRGLVDGYKNADDDNILSFLNAVARNIEIQ